MTIWKHSEEAGDSFVSQASRLSFILVILLAFSFPANAQKLDKEISINIIQAGQSAYVIRVSHPEDVIVKPVRIPEIVNAAKLSQSSNGSEAEFPVEFIATGSGLLTLSVSDPAGKGGFISFSIHNNSGEIAADQLQMAIGVLDKLPENSFILQTPSGIYTSDTMDSASLASISSATGVMFLGASRQLNHSFELDPAAIGYPLDRNIQHRLASFSELKRATVARKQEPSIQKPVLQASAEKQNEKVETPEVVTEEKHESKAEEQTAVTSQTVAANKPGPRKRTLGRGALANKAKDSIPETAFERKGRDVAAIRLAVNKDWGQGSGAGHFGEVAIPIPRVLALVRNRIERISVEFTLLPGENSPAKGRAWISDRPMLSNPRPGQGSWNAHRLNRQGRLLGEFDSTYDGQTLRYNISDWLRQNRKDRVFLTLLNLTRQPLEVTGIHFVVEVGPAN